jgi:hypothetical protein
MTGVGVIGLIGMDLGLRDGRGGAGRVWNDERTLL